MYFMINNKAMRTGRTRAFFASAIFMIMVASSSGAAEAIETLIDAGAGAANNQALGTLLTEALVQQVKEPAAPSTQGAAGEAKPKADKSQYNLFNPTPRALMREFNTDRPDVTESPYTVDAGHYQIEFSFIEYTYSHRQGERTNDYSLFPVNLKAGLTNDLDLQLILNPYQRLLTRSRGASERNAGYGDMELRAKYNLWGNDGGKTAFAIMPYLHFPTASDGMSNHHLEGGVIFPLAINLPAGFDLGTEARFDINRNERNDGYGADFVHTATLGHGLTKDLGAYIEYVGVAPIQMDHDYLAYFDSGLTYSLSENAQLDCGINIGLTGQTDNFTLFSGFSYRW